MTRTFQMAGVTFDIGPDLSTATLAHCHNEAAAVLGVKSVNRFADKLVALKRTLVIFEQAVAAGKATEGVVTCEAPPVVAEPTPAAKPAKAPKAEKPAKPAKAPKAEKAPKATAERKPRAMRFTFPVTDSVRSIRDEDSLRGQCVVLLKEGGTFKQVEKLVEKFDGKRGSSPGNIERRAYELVRIMHYYLGYGVAHNMETGIIKLRTR